MTGRKLARRVYRDKGTDSSVPQKTSDSLRAVVRGAALAELQQLGNLNEELVERLLRNQAVVR